MMELRVVVEKNVLLARAGVSSCWKHITWLAPRSTAQTPRRTTPPKGSPPARWVLQKKQGRRPRSASDRKPGPIRGRAAAAASCARGGGHRWLDGYPAAAAAGRDPPGRFCWTRWRRRSRPFRLPSTRQTSASSGRCLCRRVLPLDLWCWGA